MTVMQEKPYRTVVCSSAGVADCRADLDPRQWQFTVKQMWSLPARGSQSCLRPPAPRAFAEQALEEMGAGRVGGAWIRGRA